MLIEPLLLVNELQSYVSSASIHTLCIVQLQEIQVNNTCRVRIVMARESILVEHLSTRRPFALYYDLFLLTAVFQTQKKYTGTVNEIKKAGLSLWSMVSNALVKSNISPLSYGYVI